MFATGSRGLPEFAKTTDHREKNVIRRICPLPNVQEMLPWDKQSARSVDTCSCFTVDRKMVKRFQWKRFAFVFWSRVFGDLVRIVRGSQICRFELHGNCTPEPTATTHTVRTPRKERKSDVFPQTHSKTHTHTMCTLLLALKF